MFVAAGVTALLTLAPRMTRAAPEDQRLAAGLLVAMGVFIAAGNAWMIAGSERLDIARVLQLALGLALAARYGRWWYRNRAS